MAKHLSFEWDSFSVELEPLKLERKKLYGWTERVAFTPDGEPAEVASLDVASNTLLPKGGVGLGVLDDAGGWVEKADLIYVNEDGEEASMFPSSFDKEIVLDSLASPGELLEHNIKSIYSLQGEEQCPEFVAAIAEQNGFFKFSFNYRPSYDPDTAFLVEHEGELFVLVGQKIEFEMLSLGDGGILDDVTDQDEDEDELDFAMM